MLNPFQRFAYKFKKFIKAYPKWIDFIDISFLPVELKERYKQEIATNIERLKSEA